MTMVREVRQPSLITPQRPRVSSSATTNASRILQPGFANPSTAKGARPSGTYTVKKRLPLGERVDNVLVPASQSNEVRFGGDKTVKGRASLGPPSRPTPRIRSTPTLISEQIQTKSRPIVPASTRSTAPVRPRSSIALEYSEDDTLLLNMRPPEMSPALLLSETDDSCDEAMVAAGPGARLMTPANSQDATVSSHTSVV